jgi:hypothetical protein
MKRICICLIIGMLSIGLLALPGAAKQMAGKSDASQITKTKPEGPEKPKKGPEKPEKPKPEDPK